MAGSWRCRVIIFENGKEEKKEKEISTGLQEKRMEGTLVQKEIAGIDREISAVRKDLDEIRQIPELVQSSAKAINSAGFRLGKFISRFRKKKGEDKAQWLPKL